MRPGNESLRNGGALDEIDDSRRVEVRRDHLSPQESPSACRAPRFRPRSTSTCHPRSRSKVSTGRPADRHRTCSRDDRIRKIEVKSQHAALLQPADFEHRAIRTGDKTLLDHRGDVEPRGAKLRRAHRSQVLVELQPHAAPRSGGTACSRERSDPYASRPGCPHRLDPDTEPGLRCSTFLRRADRG